jgi:DNA replication protein DnaC
MSTILIPEKIEETSSTLSSTGSSNTYSKTKIVEEIIGRVIQPVVAKVPNVARFSGIMLLGPPGVGKSYAVSAVQFHCREICDVLIHQLSIPELLAEAKPQEIFQKKIKEIEAGEFLSSFDCLNHLR